MAQLSPGRRERRKARREARFSFLQRVEQENALFAREAQVFQRHNENISVRYSRAKQAGASEDTLQAILRDTKQATPTHTRRGSFARVQFLRQQAQTLAPPKSRGRDDAPVDTRTPEERAEHSRLTREIAENQQLFLSGFDVRDPQLLSPRTRTQQSTFNQAVERQAAANLGTALAEPELKKKRIGRGSLAVPKTRGVGLGLQV